MPLPYMDPGGRTLPDPAAVPTELVRHPRDGWVMAEPWPMGPGTRRAFQAIVAALCPPPPAPTTAELIEKVELHVRRLLRYMYPLNAVGFVLLVHALDLAPLWRLEAPARLRSLPRDRADQVLEGLAHSRLLLLRQLLMAVKGAVLSTYFDQDEVHAALGYDPRGFMMGRLDLRRRLEAGQAPRPEDRIGPFSPGLEP